MSAPTIAILATLLLLLVMIDKVPAYPVACSCPALSTGGYCPHPNDCEKFIQCNWHQEIEHTCPLNTIWYQNLRTCGHGFKAYGCSNSPIGFVCPNGNVADYADPSDCTGFVQCWDTIPFHMKCPPYHIWNESTKKCIPGTC